MTCQRIHSLLVTELRPESRHLGCDLVTQTKLKHPNTFTGHSDPTPYRQLLRMTQKYASFCFPILCLSFSHIVHILYYFILLPLNSFNAGDRSAWHGPRSHSEKPVGSEVPRPRVPQDLRPRIGSPVGNQALIVPRPVSSLLLQKLTLN